MPRVVGERQRHQGQCRLRGRAHGVDVVQRVVGGDAPERPRIVDEAAEAVDGLHGKAAGRQRDDGSVVGLAEADVDASAHIALAWVDGLTSALDVELDA